MKESRTTRGPASIQLQSANSKLRRVIKSTRSNGAAKLTLKGPACASTYVSIARTCPPWCRFKDAGCYAQSGSMGSAIKRLDVDYKGEHPNLSEAKLIDKAWVAGVPQTGARGGVDLRLHVGGDTKNPDGAEHLAAAAERFQQRGGGAVWTFTHNWSHIRRETWGPIQVLASVETTREVGQAWEMGYRAALTVREHPSDRAYNFSGVKVVPCPAETRGLTCVECRLCLEPRPPRTVIGFSIHGRNSATAKRSLPVAS